MVPRCCLWFGWSVFGECRKVNGLWRISHIRPYVVEDILSGTQHLELPRRERSIWLCTMGATRLLFYLIRFAHYRILSIDPPAFYLLSTPFRDAGKRLLHRSPNMIMSLGRSAVESGANQGRLSFFYNVSMAAQESAYFSGGAEFSFSFRSWTSTVPAGRWPIQDSF